MMFGALGTARPAASSPHHPRLLSLFFPPSPNQHGAAHFRPPPGEKKKKEKTAPFPPTSTRNAHTALRFRLMGCGVLEYGVTGWPGFGPRPRLFLHHPCFQRLASRPAIRLSKENKMRPPPPHIDRGPAAWLIARTTATATVLPTEGGGSKVGIGSSVLGHRNTISRVSTKLGGARS